MPAAARHRHDRLPGSIVSGGSVMRSILGPNCRINSFAQRRGFDSLRGSRHRPARQGRRAIIDKGVHIPPGVEIGYDHEHDRARGFTVSEGGVIVIAKADGIEHFLEAEQIVS